VLASVAPARRAAKLNMLDAIASEWPHQRTPGAGTAWERADRQAVDRKHHRRTGGYRAAGVEL